jgi:hypothetical protein
VVLEEWATFHFRNNGVNIGVGGQPPVHQVVQQMQTLPEFDPDAQTAYFGKPAKLNVEVALYVKPA